MLETNNQEKLNRTNTTNTALIPEVVETSSLGDSIVPSEPSDNRNTVQPVVGAVSPIQSESPIIQEFSVPGKKLVRETSVSSGITWQDVIDSKEQGIESPVL